MELETNSPVAALRGLLTFQLKELRADLRAAQQRTASMLAGDRAREVEDSKDEAFGRQESEIADATIDRLLGEMADCERALERLAQGRYGDCVDCGEPIPTPRLMAQPAAERCAQCQRASERFRRG